MEHSQANLLGGARPCEDGNPIISGILDQATRHQPAPVDQLVVRRRTRVQPSFGEPGPGQKNCPGELMPDCQPAGNLSLINTVVLSHEVLERLVTRRKHIETHGFYVVRDQSRHDLTQLD